MAVYDLATAPDPHATLAHALSTPGPCLIHAPIDAQEKVYPMVPPGAANKDMIGGRAPVAGRPPPTQSRGRVHAAAHA